MSSPLKAVVDHHVDRPDVEAERSAQRTGTNRLIGLIALIAHAHPTPATKIILLPCFAGLVAPARSPNPIPSRTRPLNSSAPMVLGLKTWESRSLPGLPSTASSPNQSIPAGWSSPVARQAHNLKAAGSNPAPATKIKPLTQRVSGFLLCRAMPPARPCQHHGSTAGDGPREVFAADRQSFVD
jgi:hypothetical protein